MMIYRLFQLLIISLLLTLSACSLWYNRDLDYLSACSIAPIRVPPGLSSSQIDSHYPVQPCVYYQSKQVNITPPELYCYTYAPPMRPPVLQRPVIVNRPCPTPVCKKPNYYVDPFTRTANGTGFYFSELFKCRPQPPQPVKMTPTKRTESPTPQYAKVEKPKKQLPHMYYDAFTRR